ncbi:small, acid-soluble spore protein, H family [Domibacillus antri]|uniref:Small, acid-soluble spore protein H n=1 Tax=Domibacillus antri TaxID=1714264 RepID=A0A1Q8Q1V0_9BACI|nr:H-type small acid-soluble spore protein [Domibacillus antri]OLN21314.1 small, acid-soluble spore protein, H family [Domibacillus antri]
MNKQPGKEIAASPVMANVTFNEVPVYILHVEESDETARIYPLDEPHKEQIVSLASLREH